MTAEPSFVIDGAEYPIPSLDSFNMDEAVVLYECSGLTLEDFAIDEEDPEQVDGLESKTKNPGFTKALMIVAYMRGNAGVTRKKTESLIGGSNLFEVLKAFVAVDEEDPTEPQKSEQSTPSLPESSDTSGDSSGNASATSSDSPEETPEPTGTSA